LETARSGKGEGRMPSAKATAIGLLVLIYGAVLLVIVAAVAHDLFVGSRRRHRAEFRGHHPQVRPLGSGRTGGETQDTFDPGSSGTRLERTRGFVVRCDIVVASAADAPTLATDQLRTELLARGLEEVVVIPDGPGDRLLIRGRAPAESQEVARVLVEDLIDDANLDLVIAKPGVWVDGDGRRS